MLQICKCGFGSIALSSLFGSYLSSCTTSGNDKNAAAGYGALQAIPPHFLPKAKHIIFLYMDGGVSQVDSF